MTQEEIYWAEFGLNLKHQFHNFKSKEIMQVGYQIENVSLFTLFIPKSMWIKC